MSVKERQVLLERRKKAKETYETLLKAREDYDKLEEAMDYINAICTPGMKVKSLIYGEGIIKAKEENCLLIDFSKSGEKLLGTAVSFGNSIISIDIEGFSDNIIVYKDVLKQYNLIRSRLERAEKQFEPYMEYLE